MTGQIAPSRHCMAAGKLKAKGAGSAHLVQDYDWAAYCPLCKSYYTKIHTDLIQSLIKINKIADLFMEQIVILGVKISAVTIDSARQAIGAGSKPA